MRVQRLKDAAELVIKVQKALGTFILFSFLLNGGYLHILILHILSAAVSFLSHNYY